MKIPFHSASGDRTTYTQDTSSSPRQSADGPDRYAPLCMYIPCPPYPSLRNCALPANSGWEKSFPPSASGVVGQQSFDRRLRLETFGQQVETLPAVLDDRPRLRRHGPHTGAYPRHRATDERDSCRHHHPALPGCRIDRAQREGGMKRTRRRVGRQGHAAQDQSQNGPGDVPTLSRAHVPSSEERGMLTRSSIDRTCRSRCGNGITMPASTSASWMSTVALLWTRSHRS